ncbi:MAG: glycosyltransferase family 4 protein [Solirubrobacterales bacterium]
MRVQIIDPSAFTPPYDRSLSAALARTGAEVELVTSRFLYGPVPDADGYTVTEAFYRRAARIGRDSRLRLPMKLAEHGLEMLRFRRNPGRASVRHWQWLTLPRLDRHLLPKDETPQLLTLHYPLPPPGSRRALARQRRILERFEAVVVHTHDGARRLIEDVGLPHDRVHVVPHGAFDYLTQLPVEEPLPAELAAVEGPVVLFFGLLRPYKGLDVLLEAFRSVSGAELWIAGMPRMPLDPLREAAAEAAATVRFVPRFIADPEIPAFFRRADVVVLPYREIEQSGVLYTALAFGKPIVLSAVGGFVELADAGAALAVPPGEPAPRADATMGLLDGSGERTRLAAPAAAAADGSYSWDQVAQQTRELYASLVRA